MVIPSEWAQFQKSCLKPNSISFVLLCLKQNLKENFCGGKEVFKKFYCCHNNISEGWGVTKVLQWGSFNRCSRSFDEWRRKSCIKHTSLQDLQHLRHKAAAGFVDNKCADSATCVHCCSPQWALDKTLRKCILSNLINCIKTCSYSEQCNSFLLFFANLIKVGLYDLAEKKEHQILNKFLIIFGKISILESRLFTIKRLTFIV